MLLYSVLPDRLLPALDKLEDCFFLYLGPSFFVAFVITLPSCRRMSRVAIGRVSKGARREQSRAGGS